jgi:hypothetical protein
MRRSERIVLGFLAFLTAAPTSAADWSGCVSALQNLESAAQQAQSAADDAETAEDEADSQKERYERCRRYPDSYDTMSDGCATYARRYRNAKDDYDSAVSSIESEISDVASAFNEVQSACQAGGAAGGDVIQTCLAYKQLKGKYSDAELLAACMTKLRNERLCRACVGVD